jgi:hypothetical protein
MRPTAIKISKDMELKIDVLLRLQQDDKGRMVGVGYSGTEQTIVRYAD